MCLPAAAAVCMAGMAAAPALPVCTSCGAAGVAPGLCCGFAAGRAAAAAYAGVALPHSLGRPIQYVHCCLLTLPAGQEPGEGVRGPGARRQGEAAQGAPHSLPLVCAPTQTQPACVLASYGSSSAKRQREQLVARLLWTHSLCHKLQKQLCAVPHQQPQQRAAAAGVRRAPARQGRPCGAACCWVLCPPTATSAAAAAKRGQRDANPNSTCPTCVPAMFCAQVKGPVRMPTRVLKITTRKSPCGNGCVLLRA